MATILMIEDDERFLRSIGQELTLHGHTLLHAGTASEGIQQAASQALDLVLLGVDLPDLDGKVVASALRTHPGLRATPIVAVTARDDVLTRELMLAFGCSGVLPRPTEPGQLSHQIAAYLK